jgi:hypothetical protein
MAKMFLESSSNWKLPRYPSLFWFDLLDLTLLKNVGNDIDDLVQFNMILLLWSVLNQTLIGSSFVESYCFNQVNQNFITSYFIWSFKFNQFATLINLLLWSIYCLDQIMM